MMMNDDDDFILPRVACMHACMSRDPLASYSFPIFNNNNNSFHQILFFDTKLPVRYSWSVSVTVNDTTGTLTKCHATQTRLLVNSTTIEIAPILPMISSYSVGFLLFAVLLVSVTTCCCHGWLMPAASSTPAPSAKAKTTTTRTARRAALKREVPDGEGNEKSNIQMTRREAFRDAFVTTSAAAVATTGVGLFSSPSWSVAAAEEVQSSSPSSSSSSANAAASSEILLRLRSIPVFSIVDPNGVPFMIFDGQAKATGYFFLSFDIAAQALQDARQKDKNTGAAQVWANAKIIVVPLAVALQLSLRKSQREAINGNGIKFNTFNDLVPSQEGVDDAKALDNNNPAKWEQKGRVPLFYIKGLTLDNGKEPRYFNQRDLLQEWERQKQQQQQQPPPPPPTIQIVEMVDLYRAALSSSNGNSLDAISNLAIMPVAESNQVASKLIKSDGTLPSYSFNKVFLVGSAKG